jgi:formylglycine-generating enzyme required for sulfatase activity
MVSPFHLDTYEVTVARFRRFVAAYPAFKISPGAGAHPRIADSGWQAAYDVYLAESEAVLREKIAAPTRAGSRNLCVIAGERGRDWCMGQPR